MSEKKKILHLITGLEVGGAEMMLLKTLPKLQEDFDNRVCCIRNRGPIGKRLEEAGIPVFFLDLNSILDFGAIFRFRNIIKKFDPDILVTYLIHADLFGRIFGRLFGVKKIVCSQRGKLLQWEFLRLADRLTKYLVTKYIVQTEVSKKELIRKLRLPAEKIIVVPNAIDTTEFEFKTNKEKQKESLGLVANNIIITCISKLRRGKGHEYLLEAFEQLFCCSKQNKEYPTDKQFKLLIVGDGEQKEKLLEQAKDYKSKQNILFLGNRDDVKEILHITDIFILPTLGEGMSNALMEAMASGLPIITTNIPENQELIEHEKTGILVPSRNSNALAQSMEQLIANPTLCNYLGTAARISIKKHYDLPIVTKRIKIFLDSFFSGHLNS